MDSRKFKKIDDHTPKNKKRKNTSKHKNRNYSRNKNNHKETIHKNHNIHYNNNVKNYKNDTIYSTHQKRKKSDKQINYAKILGVCAVLIALIAIGLFAGTLIQTASIPNDAQLIKPVGFNLTPYGYDWNNQLYGEAVVSQNATNDSYYFTLNQMAALASASDNTFNFTDGIYVSYNTNNSRGVKVVEHVYDAKGKEIIKPDKFDEYDFVSNARFTGRNSPYCLEGFGFTKEEYESSVF